MQHPLIRKRDKEKRTRPVWCNLKSNNTSRTSFRVLVIHDSKTQVVIDKIFLLLALYEIGNSKN